ncbi:hypothetical protein NIES2119_23420 [[Phormidium ambiguum] IAM M-71]|uniref:Beta-Ig-H3/fasciclin n=1 Tax=[Phormidium ambiguum] IAM M-71 TaxID=454136 RepID=A0A1U7IA16_9CYAN|nr:hypothetical protein [Phormidium ambiguum]OKH33352.1 hypothetical protein NIES2119_23420 [Phormidium ambiguum IAM M-71]
MNKKFLTVVFGLGLAFTLAACGEQPAPETPATTPATTPAAPATPAAPPATPPATPPAAPKTP